MDPIVLRESSFPQTLGRCLSICLFCLFCLFALGFASAASAQSPCNGLGFEGPDEACCGDGICSLGELCPGDCNVCGDGTCSLGEHCSNCALDCGACPSCGDGVCNGSETCFSCSADCQNSCFSAPFFTFFRGEHTVNIFSNYTFNGSTWYGDTTLGNSAQSTESPAAAVFNNRIFAYYGGQGSGELYVSYSDDGQVWQGNHVIGNGDTTTKEPGVAVFGNQIHLFYSNSTSIYHATSSDGLTFGPSQELFTGVSGSHGPPSAIAFNGKLWLGFSRASDRQVVFYTTTDGVNWTLEPTPSSYTDTGIGLAEFDGELWMAYSNRITRVLHVRSMTTAGVWNTAIPLDNAKSYLRPTLAADDNRMITSWLPTDSTKVAASTSTDGVNWTFGTASKGWTNSSSPYVLSTD